MAIAYKSQGAGAATTTTAGQLQALCPATVDANDILIAHVCYRDTSSVPATPGTWTLLAGPQAAGSTPTGRHWVFGKIAAGTEDGSAVQFGTAGSTNVRHARIYSFSGWVAGAITDVVVDITHVAGTSTAIADIGVTTTAAGSVAVNLVYITDDNAFGPYAGETGGNWVDAVAEFTTTLGSDGCMAIQIATMASIGTVDGGSFTMAASDPWGVYGFEIRDQAPAASQDFDLTPATETDSAQPLTTVGPIEVNLTPVYEADTAAHVWKLYPATDLYPVGIDAGSEIGGETVGTGTVGYRADGTSSGTGLLVPVGIDAHTSIGLGTIGGGTVGVREEAAGGPLDLTPATETDSAVALSVTKPIVKTLTATTETGTSQALNVDKTLTLAAAAETNTTIALDADKSDTLSPAAEADAAIALSVTKAIFKTLTPVVETDTSQALSITKTIFVILGAVTETDVAQAVTYSQAGSVTISPALETDTAESLSVTKTIFVTLTPATETSASQPLAHVKTVTLIPAVETDTAQAFASTEPPDTTQPTSATLTARTITAELAARTSDADIASRVLSVSVTGRTTTVAIIGYTAIALIDDRTTDTSIAAMTPEVLIHA